MPLKLNLYIFFSLLIHHCLEILWMRVTCIFFFQIHWEHKIHRPPKTNQHLAFGHSTFIQMHPMIATLITHLIILENNIKTYFSWAIEAKTKQSEFELYVPYIQNIQHVVFWTYGLKFFIHVYIHTYIFVIKSVAKLKEKSNWN